MIIPEFDDILSAAERLQDVAIRTPLLPSPVLSEHFGAQIYLKAENLQRTGSFKFRGAYNALSRIPEADKPKGVLAISSGNHAQGIAEAARLLGFQAIIIMPSDAPEVKIARTRASGAKVIFYDRGSDDRETITRQLVEKTGAVFIHPFDNADVIAGQGTAGLEIAAELQARNEEPDVLLACTGGGGFTAGLALACKTSFPDMQIFSVEPDGFDDYRRSLDAGRIVANEATTGSLCDAILTPAPGAIGFEINSQRLTGGLSVSDEEALQAVRYCFDHHRVLAEPGGVVALAAILSGKLEERIGSLSGRTIVATISGGNIDRTVLLRALDAVPFEFHQTV